MSSTRVSEKEFKELSKLMEKAKTPNKITPKKVTPTTKTLLESQKSTTNFYNLPKYMRKKLAGGRKHRQIETFIINKLIKKGFSYTTEQGIFFSKLNKKYVIDIFTNNKKKDIAIECGNCSKSKVSDLSKHFEVIHISYYKFKILQQAEEIFNNIEKVLANA